MVSLLVYELVDEILDFGWPQCASTAELQPFIFNKAVELVRAQGGAEDDVLKGGAQADLDQEYL